jgi:hypothetical protein
MGKAMATMGKLAHLNETPKVIIAHRRPFSFSIGMRLGALFLSFKL